MFDTDPGTQSLAPGSSLQKIGSFKLQHDFRNIDFPEAYWRLDPGVWLQNSIGSGLQIFVITIVCIVMTLFALQSQIVFKMKFDCKTMAC